MAVLAKHAYANTAVVTSDHLEIGLKQTISVAGLVGRLELGGLY
jgi:hypothetical protein